MVRADASARDNRALRCAASSGHIGVVNMLLLMMYALMLRLVIMRRYEASHNYRVDGINRLLAIDKVRANAVEHGNDALISAVYNGHLFL